jgi:hypothetical protein
LNGAQITSLLEIVGQVSRREIPRETGIAIITQAFPIDAAAAERLMGSVGVSFFAPVEGAAPAPAAPAPAPEATLGQP